MNCEQARIDVAAHALGTLNKADGEAVDRHMRECRACRAAYEEHASLVLLMASVSPQDIIPMAPPGDRRGPVRPDLPGSPHLRPETPAGRSRPPLPGDAYAEPRVRRHRRAGRARFALLAGAVAALPSAAVLWFILQAQPSDDGSAAAAAPGGSRTVQASDEATGVRAAVTSREQKWGTDLRLDLAGANGVTGKWRLVVVTDSGEHETVSSWSMPRRASAAQGTPLRVTGTTALPPDRIEAYLIEEASGAGGGHLLRVPAS